MKVNFLISILSIVLSLNPFMNLQLMSDVVDAVSSRLHEVTQMLSQGDLESGVHETMLLSGFKRKRGEYLC